MTPGTQRVDKWLWYARLVKSRTLAAALVAGGAVRVNRVRIAKASHAVGRGDVLTIQAHGHVRVVRVLEPGKRRGPAAEARLLYEDLASPAAAPGDG